VLRPSAYRQALRQFSTTSRVLRSACRLPGMPLSLSLSLSLCVCVCVCVYLCLSITLPLSLSLSLCVCVCVSGGQGVLLPTSPRGAGYPEGGQWVFALRPWAADAAKILPNQRVLRYRFSGMI
jgi:hypothetical protein